MLNVFILVLMFYNILAWCGSEILEQHPDVGLNVLDLIEKYDYPVERHQHIETSDGYLLEMHRIPHGKNNARETNKPVVFLMHGLLRCSVDWVMMGPDNSLGFLLADLGYDVWMGNARGNTWSRKHVEYNPNKDSQFWKFSWNEIGKIDLPTKIDYILKTTGQQDLFYIGHSQGTTSYFVMMSERPEYNEKVKLMIALAPVAFMSHLANPFLQFIANFDGPMEVLAELMGIDEFLPDSKLYDIIGMVGCKDKLIFQNLCANIIFLIVGFDSEELNKTTIPIIVSSAPAGSSTKQLLHYAQGINSGKFRQYDYGLVENLIKYGSIDPPDYPLDQISSKIALFYSSNDWLAAIIDVNELYSKLPNVVYNYLLPHEKFNHLDYLFAIDVVDMLYNRIFSLFEEHKG